MSHKKYINTTEVVSPSTAASYCSGRSCNGWIHWINDEGQSLDEVYRSE